MKEDRTLDSMDDIIKLITDRYGGTWIALNDCPNIAKEMKKYRFEDKKIKNEDRKTELGDDPMCDRIRDCTMKYMDDKINHPKHYCEGRKHEPWDVIKDWELDYDLGCAVKYISRAGRKDASKKLEDLEKAKAYLQHEIDTIMKETGENGRI